MAARSCAVQAPFGLGPITETRAVAVSAIPATTVCKECLPRRVIQARITMFQAVLAYGIALLAYLAHTATSLPGAPPALPVPPAP
jgi:hypothetical protein